MSNTCRMCGRWKPLQSPLCDVCTNRQIAKWQNAQSRILHAIALIIPLGVAVITWLVAKAVR